MRQASCAAMWPNVSAARRSSVSSRSSHGLAMATNEIATIPASRTASCISGACGAALVSCATNAGRMLELQVPAELRYCRLEIRIKIKALKGGQRTCLVRRFLLVLFETQTELAISADRRAELEPDGGGDEGGQAWVG